ncbi:hypothetical protein EYS14_01605 [Alteromonadaceae bacterium M269]|nr:hypothetical protein EYS14_01605 [Alteromonadaceae bacterium M269]
MSHKSAAASYFANGGAIVFGVFTVQELGVAVGIILGVLTFITNLYYIRKQEQRERELHDKRMRESYENN